MLACRQAPHMQGIGHANGLRQSRLVMQVALDCKERGTLLAAVWAHCMALVELRCNLVSRQTLQQQEGVSAALRQEAFAAATAVKCVDMHHAPTPINDPFPSHAEGVRHAEG